GGPLLSDAIVVSGEGGWPICARASIVGPPHPLRPRFAAAGRDPDAISVAVMGATTDPGGLEQLGREGVDRAILTVWSEDRDEVLRTLDAYRDVMEAAQGAAGG
ncbi:MAG: hypothetical protein AAGD18_26545, partial [Actinomycetota bacterium]